MSAPIAGHWLNGGLGAALAAEVPPAVASALSSATSVTRAAFPMILALIRTNPFSELTPTSFVPVGCGTLSFYPNLGEKSTSALARTPPRSCARDKRLGGRWTAARSRRASRWNWRDSGSTRSLPSGQYGSHIASRLCIHIRTTRQAGVSAAGRLTTAPDDLRARRLRIGARPLVSGEAKRRLFCASDPVLPLSWHRQVRSSIVSSSDESNGSRSPTRNCLR